jgi:acyl-CoA thioesterase YciA
MHMDAGDINFYTRKWVRPEDLNAHGTLFGGSLLRWIDEEAVVYAVIQLGNRRVVTKYMSEIDFVSSAELGDIVEIGLIATDFGRTSVSMRAEVRNVVTGNQILTVDRIVFVGVDEDGRPLAHGHTAMTRSRERLRIVPG